VAKAVDFKQPGQFKTMIKIRKHEKITQSESKPHGRAQEWNDMVRNTNAT
jgi:hypothetical protein